ncbi:hypothetical protein VNO80_09468 [Phaseolus coccineus]|uniref:Uncharacterized protein n=1 Tax=Phaseolus coccineus TaxID=3886 RepID=A0AAN9N6V2_PHACN
MLLRVRLFVNCIISICGELECYLFGLLSLACSFAVLVASPKASRIIPSDIIVRKGDDDAAVYILSPFALTYGYFVLDLGQWTENNLHRFYGFYWNVWRRGKNRMGK